ncbi:uncharacterized protein L201_002260 [Kwoniella dendrophila CBS 6074]|uniref:Uncharacterized protein n=1 Tax=Kwoniella dendrophila CBS 6074 TaxID=1295534 RepID=A0AAX4JPQ9_9TREE
MTMNVDPSSMTETVDCPTESVLSVNTHSRTEFRSPSEVISFLGYNPTQKSAKIGNDPYDDDDKATDKEEQAVTFNTGLNTVDNQFCNEAQSFEEVYRLQQDGKTSSKNSIGSSHIAWAKEDRGETAKITDSRGKKKARPSFRSVSKRFMNRNRMI